MEQSKLESRETQEVELQHTDRMPELTDQQKEKLDRSLFGDTQDDNDVGQEQSETPVRQEWSEEERQFAQQESGYSDTIIDLIRSSEEVGIYRKAGLQETQIGGKPALVRDDIDINQTDGMGRTNLERMESGLAPLSQEGKPIELHHIGQKTDSPLAELTVDEHRGKGNDTILHDKTVDSEIDRNVFNGQKEEHWKNRAKELSAREGSE